METAKLIAELAVVLGAIVMGTRYSGVALGLWGGTGVAVLVFIFREEVGSPPVDALLIVLSVVLASSLMQIAGGIDWMVSVAAKIISRHPNQITLIAPLIAFVFSVGSGTSNILYPLLPVITDLSYKQGIRPSRPLSLSVVATGIALACSPVSAAMAAMVTLTEKDPYNFDLIKIVIVTLPAAIIGIVISSFVVRRLGKDIADDPEIQAKIAAGKIEAPHALVAKPSGTINLKGKRSSKKDAATKDKASAVTPDAVSAGKPAEVAAQGESAAPSAPIVVTKQGRLAAQIFLLGVLAIVIFGLFDGLRPLNGVGEPVGMTPVIEVIMFVVGTLILVVSRPKVAEVPSSSVFKAGMVSAIALFGLAWLTDTFISAHSAVITSTIGDMVTSVPAIFALGVFVVCVLTTSQSTATRTIVPIGLAAGLAPGLISGMWAGAFAGVYLLPTNGSQIAAANFDYSGSTKLGNKLYDHSFFIPTIVLAVTTIGAGLVLGGILG